MDRCSDRRDVTETMFENGIKQHKINSRINYPYFSGALESSSLSVSNGQMTEIEPRSYRFKSQRLIQIR